MAAVEVYTTLEGEQVCLGHLDDEERRLVARLRKRARTHPDWTDFDNYWMKEIAEFYDARGMPRKKSGQTPAFRIAQDLSGRLGIASGLVRLGDYRDDLAEIVRTQFRTQCEFCEATGLSEDMLCHVLKRRKHLAIDTLEEALNRIGYMLHIKPLPKIDAVKPAKRPKPKRRSAG